MIGLDWSEGPYNGGTPVIDYQVSYAEVEEGVWSIYSTNVIETIDIIINLTPGKSYRFVVQARNLVGLSQESTTIDIEAA